MSSSHKPSNVELTDLRDRAETLQREVDRGSEVQQDLRDRLASQTRRRVEADELFRLLVESVNDYAIFMLDPEGHVATWNPGAERFKGYKADEIIGRHFSTFYPDTDVRSGKCERELEVALREGRFEEEGWRVRKDGTQFWANVVITAVHAAAGELVGFAKVTRDLTERMLADERRRAAEERYRLLVESVQDYAIFILDQQGHVSTWTSAAERIKGYTAEEIIGSHFSRFYPPEDVRAGKCDHELEVAARVGRFEDEDWRVRKDGSRFWANVVISAIRDRSGALVGFSKVTRDLTERKRAEEERAARLAAEQSNRTKDAFLAVLGHELRNPLAPVVTALQLIKLRGDPRSAREHQVIERQIKHMKRLVDDLLDVSRITHGKIALHKQPIDVRDALAKAVEIAIPWIEEKGLHFEVKSPPRPLVVDADEARLVQVFSNLLHNASKFTAPGGHVFALVRRSGPHVVVEVRDDGIGLDAEQLARVFDLFVQGPQSGDRAAGGLGLGLTLVRFLVQLHGGEVEARSSGSGKGSSFTVRLPAADQAPEAPDEDEADVLSTRAPASPAARRILVVDDNEDARSLLADLLRAFGYEVAEAGDGAAALRALEASAPNVALLDIGLPDMDGYELAARIREAPNGREVRLIALSGYGAAPDQARSAAARFEHHLVKPVEAQRLQELLAGLEGPPPAEPPEAEPRAG